MKLQISKLIEKIENNINNFKNKSILVIGDIILDRWLKGVVDRISPEAPVPVLRVEKEWNDLGGAANVAKILSFYCNNVTIIGNLGKDQFAYRIKKLIKKYNINDMTFCYDKTIVKTRLIAHNNQQIARVDREKENFKIPELILKQKLQNLKQKFDLVYLIDYNKGIFNKNTVDLISELIDSELYISIKPSNFNSFIDLIKNKRIKLLSFNKQEFKEICKQLNLNNSDIFENMEMLLNSFRISKLLVTLGKDGLTLANSEYIIKVDGIEVEVFDVTGAGDNVISIFGILNSSEFDDIESSLLANIAGSICVSKPGTIAVKPKDILSFLYKSQKINQKLLDFDLKYKKIVNKQ